MKKIRLTLIAKAMVILTMAALVQSTPALYADKTKIIPDPELNLTGTWEYISTSGKKRKLFLTQTGTSVTGTIKYTKGSARITGTVKGDTARLTVIYDNPQLLSEWVPLTVARQIVGITSLYVLKATSNPNKLNCDFYGWKVYWDADLNVTKRYNGGEPGNPANKYPDKKVLVRVQAPIGGEVGPSPTSSIWVEAEDETAYNVFIPTTPGEWSWRSRELANLPHSGRGYWYLSRGGDWLLYVIDVPRAGMYKLWIKDANDRKHPYGARTVEIFMDCKKIASVPETSNPGPDTWGWHIAGTINYLSRGKHVMLVRKEATTSAAALIDAFYLTTGSERPTHLKQK